MPIIVLIILAMTGGVGYASKSALPGDALYGVKIAATEPIEEVLAFGPQAESAVHIEHAMERLREVEQLKNVGMFDVRKQAYMKFAFENEVSKINAAIETLNAAKDFARARAIEKSLRDSLKKSAALAVLYADISSDKEEEVVNMATVGPQADPENQPQRAVEPTIRTPVVAAPVSAAIQPTSTKYVPKFLPQRGDISRDDDSDDEEDDD